MVPQCSEQSRVTIMHESPEGSLATSPTRPNLASSLREMVDAYWGNEGDGGKPPHCIRQAQLLLDAYVDEMGRCPGGARLTSQSCEKCGATMDDECKFEPPKKLHATPQSAG